MYCPAGFVILTVSGATSSADKMSPRTIPSSASHIPILNWAMVSHLNSCMVYAPSRMSAGSQLSALAMRPTVRGFTSSPRMIRVSVCGLVPLRKSVSAIHRRASIMLSLPTSIFTISPPSLKILSNHFGCSTKIILPNRLFVNYVI